MHGLKPAGGQVTDAQAAEQVLEAVSAAASLAPRAHGAYII